MIMVHDKDVREMEVFLNGVVAENGNFDKVQHAYHLLRRIALAKNGYPDGKAVPEENTHSDESTRTR